MSNTRTALVALAGVAALFAAKNLRHADEASFAVGPVARAALHEVEDGHAADAMTAAEIIQGPEEKNGTD